VTERRPKRPRDSHDSQASMIRVGRELLRDLNEANSEGEVAHVLVERLATTLGATAASVGVVDGQEIRILHRAGEGGAAHPAGSRLSLASSAPLAAAARTGESVSAKTDEPTQDDVQGDASEVVAIPLRSGAGILGSIAFWFGDDAQVDAGVVAAAELGGEMGVQALERIDRDRQAREALDGIARVAPRFDAETPESVTEMICRQARETFRSDIAQLWELEDDHFMVRHREPAAAGAVPAGGQFDIDDFPGLRDAVARLDPMFIEDSLLDIRGVGLDQARRFGIRSSLRVPIAVSGETRHVLVLQWSTVEPAPQPFQLLLARRYADQAGLALEHAERRVAQLDAARNADDIRRLLDITTALAGAGDAVSVAQAAVTEAVRSLGATAGAIAMVEGPNLRILASGGYSAGVLEGWESFPLDAGVPLSDAVKNSKVVAVESPDQLARLYPALHARSGHQTWLAVPLEVGGRVIGGITLSFADPRTLTDGDRSFMLALARQATQAYERARLFDVEHTARVRAEHVAREIAQLHALATSLGGATRPEEIGEVIVDQMLDGVTAALACAFVVRGEEIVLVAIAGDAILAERIDVESLPVRDGSPLQIAISDAAAHWIMEDDQWASSGVVEVWRAAGIGAVGVVPLVVDATPIGALLVLFERGATPPAEERRFVETVARQASQPLSRLRLLSDERATRMAVELTNRRMSGIQTVTERLAAAPTVAAVGEVMIAEARTALGGSRAAVHVERRAGEGLERLARWEPPETGSSWSIDQLDPAVSPIADALRLGDVVVHETRPTAQGSGSNPPPSTLLAVPLTVGGRTLGVLTIAYDAPQPLTEEDLKAATTVGRQCAQALDRSRLFDEERIARDRSERLQDLTVALSPALTTRDVTEVFLQRSARSVGASLVAIGVLDEQGRIPPDSWEGDVSWVPAAWLEPGAGDRTPVRDALLRGVPLYLGRDDTTYPETASIGNGGDGSSFAFVPLVTAEKPFALTMFVWDAHRVPTDDDRAFLETFASQCAQAFDRAHRYEVERMIAETLQKSMLPETFPTMEGTSVAARYLPGTALVEVGGDWFDTITLPDGRLAFVVGVVVGKGVQAASTMAQLRNGLRALALDSSDPAAIVTKLNRLLESYNDAPFATMVLVVVDPRSYRVALVSAGHLPPLVISPDGRPTFLTTGAGIPLGVDPGFAYTAGETDLAPGSTVILFTDGLVERRDRPLDEGLDLLALAVEGATAPPEELVDLVLERLIGEAARSDDVAVLVIGLDRQPLGSYTETLPADSASLVDLRASFGRWLDRAGIPPEERGDLILAVWEASANAIEHARDPVSPTFSIEARLDGNAVCIEVTDTGAWRDQEQRPDRGLGLELMRALMTKVEIEHGSAGTRVQMERVLGTRPADTGGH
jgi:GAF domain-containing protein/anti-sigma regulatory factor (Ser/Thr protein kinase)